MSELTSKIQVLDDNTINKIAAGEVVERPAAIVREVVENAIDAGSDDIRVELEMGGTKLIRIQDNGCGMNRLEAELSLQRHATSKIRTDGDLFNIHTLGFRGEAIPSIASVSQFELLTRTSDATAGTKVIVHGGKLISIDAAGCPVGTSITARNLFYNVPARQKFLRAHNTEYSHCLEAVVREMLIRPHIDVEVKHNRVSVLRAPKTDSLQRRAEALLGSHWGAVIPISFENEFCSVEGLVSPVGVHRASSANATYLYVNERFVKDTSIRRAVSDAYHGIVPKGRYPLVLLSVKVKPSEVDVNVHPAKTEVRFQQVLDVGQSITQGLRAELQKQGIRREVPLRTPPSATPLQGLPPLPEKAPRIESLALFASQEKPVEYNPTLGNANREAGMNASLRTSFPQSNLSLVETISTPSPLHVEVSPKELENVGFEDKLVREQAHNLFVEPMAIDGVPTIEPLEPLKNANVLPLVRTIDPRSFPPSFFGWSADSIQTVAHEPMLLPLESPLDVLDAPAFPLAGNDQNVGLGDLLPVATFAELRVIGQLKETYILCEGAGELVIIDQHAAHERITLDAIQRRRMDFIGGFQQLLTPILIDVPPTQLARLLPLLPMFAEFGLEMEEFGGNTIRITQIPTILENSNWEQLIQDLVDDAMAGGRGNPVHEKLELALATRACHGSIRAGRVLSNFEMQEILEDLDTVDFGVCAHGRPVAIRITPYELEKQFHRS